MSPECPPRSLRGRHWFLTGVSGVVLNTNVLMPRGVFVQSFESLAALELSNLQGISRVSSKVSKRMSLAIDWNPIVRKVPDMLRGISVKIWKS